ncbi:hypothetical protein MPLB_2040056 [Mesorhizobium sp. ORS 3324]|nr:hypothetical protein MPLB_2040056 [Mesorhizobium sp. ORS 3324]
MHEITYDGFRTQLILGWGRSRLHPHWHRLV